MPKKRESHPVQVWLADTDRYRLGDAAKRTGRSRSELCREAIRAYLEQLERQEHQQVIQQQEEALFKALTTAAREVIAMAKAEAEALASPRIGSEHLLLALTSNTKTKQALGDFGMTWKILKNKVMRVRKIWFGDHTSAEEPDFSDDFKQTISRAGKISGALNDTIVDTEHILLALLAQEIGPTYDVLDSLGIDRAAMKESILKTRAKYRKDKSRPA